MHDANFEADKEQDTLSEVWQELLGRRSQKGVPALSPIDENIPILPADPWNSLSHDQDIEVVDLQAIDLSISDQDVEEILRIMKEDKPGK